MRILFLIILGAGFYLPLSVSAGDLEAGKAKATITCRTCHGLDGKATIPMAANLSGQQKDYMEIQLKNFRSGKRNHNQMSIIAKSLTDDEIDNLTEWYSSIKVTVETPKDNLLNSETVKKIEDNMQKLIK